MFARQVASTCAVVLQFIVSHNTYIICIAVLTDHHLGRHLTPAACRNRLIAFLI